MNLTKEDEALLANFAQAALTGYMASQPDTSINHYNYGVVATGCYNMAKAMFRAHKMAIGSIPEELKGKHK